MINEAQFGVSHHPVTILPDNPDAITVAGTGINLPTLYPPYAGWIPNFSFGGTRIGNSPNLRYGGGGAYSPFYSKNAIIEATDTLSMIHEKHSIKTGIFIHRNRKDQTVYAQTSGAYNWGDTTGNPFDTGFGFSNAAIGVFQSFNQSSRSANGEYRFTNLEFFGQDTWKVTPRLTLSYGVRAAWVQPEFDRLLQTSNFFPDKCNPSQAPRLFWPCVDPATSKKAACDGSPSGPVAGGPEIIGNIVPNSGNLTNGVLAAGNGISKYLREGPGLLLGPHLGVAYDLTGHQNLFFRAGAAKYFDRLDGNEIFNLLGNPPTIFQPTVFNGFAQSLSSNRSLLAPTGLTAISFNGNVPTSYKFSAGIQSKLRAMTLDVAYVGSLGRHLQDNLQLNPVPYGADFLPANQDCTKFSGMKCPNPPQASYSGSQAYDPNFLRPYRGYGGITLEEFGATSNYHSLQVSVDRRVAKGLFLGVAYTWSKCLQINDGTGHRIDNLNRLANYGPCQWDIRHNLNFNYVYPLPGVSGLGSFNNRVTRTAFNGWQLSGFTQFRTGGRYSPSFSINGVNNNNNLTGSQDFGPRVMLIDNPYAGTTDSPYNRLNPVAFAPASVGSIGIDGPFNYLTNPGVSNWDMSLRKSARLTERLSLQLRIDAFNVFNHTQFSGVNSGIQFQSLINPVPTNLPYDANGNLVRTNGFGTINGVRNPRSFQTVVRLVF